MYQLQQSVIAAHCVLLKRKTHYRNASVFHNIPSALQNGPQYFVGKSNDWMYFLSTEPNKRKHVAVCCCDNNYVSLFLSQAVYIIFTDKVDGKGEAFVDIFQNAVSVCCFLQGAVSSTALSLFHSVFSHSLFLVHFCKINGSKNWEASLPVRKAPSVLLSISISVHSVDLTYSYVPLHQWKTKQQKLTAVMRTTISSLTIKSFPKRNSQWSV